MWKNIEINIQNIVAETEKSILVKCPNKSEWNGYVFWVAKKCTRKGSHSYALIIGLNTDFDYKLTAKHAKTYEVLDEKVVNASEIMKAFNQDDSEDDEEVA